MRTASIFAVGLVAAVAAGPAADLWGDEDFGPLDDAPLGNSSNGSNGTNSTTTTTTTTVTATTTTTTTTLPKYDFINVAFFKVGDATKPTTSTPAPEGFDGVDVGNETTTTTTTTTTTQHKDANCAINAPGQKSYFAKLSRTGCNCTAMPKPPRGWESWAGEFWHGFAPHYQLTMAAPTAEGNQVSSFHAFCNPTCTKCNIHRVSDETKLWNETCSSEVPLPTEVLDYNTCDQAGEVLGESFFIRQPADADHMGEEFCVLDAEAAAAAAVEGAFTIVEYPHATACDANGTNVGFREGAMIGQTYPEVADGAGVCKAAYDGSYYDLSSEFDPTTNQTVYDGTINCMAVDPKDGNYCDRKNCDYVGKVPVGVCASIEDKSKASYSLKIIGAGDVTQCYIKPSPAPPSPTPPGPSKAKGNKGVVIGAAVAGAAVLGIVVVIIVRKRRASRAQAYSVLQGSAYTEN